MKSEKQDKNHVIKHAKVLKVFGILLGYVIAFISLLIATSISWMFRTWTGLTMNELMFHIQSPIEGTDNGIIISYITSCLLVTVGIILFVGVIYHFLRRKRGLILLCTATVSVFVAGVSISYMWNRLDITAYASNRSVYSTFIDDNYVNPQDVEITFPKQKRNLIYIYLESMEVTYANKDSGGAYEDNYIPELTALSKENENFSGSDSILNGGISLNGSTWTVAAMFGQSTGLPLMIPISDNDMDTQTSFFPGLTAIGDILHDAGYSQYILMGSEATFAGRDLFYSQHGDYTIYDYVYSRLNDELPKDYRVFWGYEDKKLFDLAKKHLTEISLYDDPFNMTILTVDTHFEDGYVCEDCQSTYGNNQYANVISCSSKKVTEFVEWIKKQDFYQNTTIVISGDHPTMDSDFCNNVDDDYKRKVYTTYINSAAQVKNDIYREYSTFDNFPTTLASLGAEIEGDRLGLGTNLFSSEITLLEKYGQDVIDTELEKKSKLMDKLTNDIIVPEDVAAGEEKSTGEEEKGVPVEIEVTPYDFKTGKYEVRVNNIPSESNIQGIRCAVWGEEDQSDLKWYEAEAIGDGSYVMKIWASDFAYKTKEYKVHIYSVNNDGDPVLLGESVGEITG